MIQGRDLGLETPELRAIYGQQGKWKVFGDYMQIVRRDPRTARVIAAAQRMEGVPGHVGDARLQGAVEQLQAVEPGRQGRPEEEAAGRARPAGVRREVPGQRLEHGVAALVVDVAQLAHVAVEEAAAGGLPGHHLGERGGVQVGALLELHQPVDDLRRRHHPADAQAGGKRLRQGAHVDDVAACTGPA